MRIAKQLGSVEALLPEGITTVADLPFPIFEALRSALVYLSWEENLPSDEIPPRRIWDDSEKLGEHFKLIERRRKQKAEGKDIDDPVENEAAKNLIVE